jgi:dipeptidase E
VELVCFHRFVRLKMRLALYSDQEIAANAAIDERALRLIGVRQPRIGYVSSASDPQRSDFERKRSYYRRLGVELTMYVDSESEDLEEDLRDLGGCDAIHLAGGNTFEFLRWLKERHVLSMLRTYAVEDRGVLIGASAGAILMTPSIETALLCGDVRPAGSTDDEALGVVDFYFWPHYRRGAELTIALDPGRPLYGCEDGMGIIVDGAALELHGAVPIAQQPVAAVMDKVPGHEGQRTAAEPGH